MREFHNDFPPSALSSFSITIILSGYLYQNRFNMARSCSSCVSWELYKFSIHFFLYTFLKIHIFCFTVLFQTKPNNKSNSQKLIIRVPRLFILHCCFYLLMAHFYSQSCFHYYSYISSIWFLFIYWNIYLLTFY